MEVVFENLLFWWRTTEEFFEKVDNDFKTEQKENDGKDSFSFSMLSHIWSDIITRQPKL